MALLLSRLHAVVAHKLMAPMAERVNIVQLFFCMSTTPLRTGGKHCWLWLKAVFVWRRGAQLVFSISVSPRPLPAEGHIPHLTLPIALPRILTLRTLLVSWLKYTVTQESLVLPPLRPPKKESSQMWNVPSQFADQKLSCVSLKIVQSRLIARKEETPPHACEPALPSRLKTLCCFCAKDLAQHLVKCAYWLPCLTELDKEISRFARPRKIHPRLTSSKATTCHFTFLLVLSWLSIYI